MSPVSKQAMRTVPVVSVIIPTFNRAAMLREALESVFAQEGAGAGFTMEVIVVDDASSDDTPAVVRAYPRVQYIRLPTNRGLPAARNAGIKASTGKYLAFLDDDDLWFPRRLKIMVPVLEGHPEAALAYGQVIMKTPENESILPKPRYAPSGSVLGRLLMGNFVSVPAVLARREAVEKAGYFDEGLGSVEDYDLWIRLARDFHFLFVATPVAVYRYGFQSKVHAELTDGRFGHWLLHVLRKALATLPDMEEYALIKQDTQACIDFLTACTHVFNGHVERARPLLEAGLLRLPMMTHRMAAQHSLAGFVGQLAVASPSPIAATQMLCEEITRDAPSRSYSSKQWVRQLKGEIWGAVAIQLGFGVRARDGDATLAALRAARQNLTILGGRKKLVWLLARRLVGRRLDPIFKIIRLWAQRRTSVR